MVMGNQVPGDGVPYDDARNHRALPVGAVRVIIAYVAVEVECLVGCQVNEATHNGG